MTSDEQLQVSVCQTVPWLSVAASLEGTSGNLRCQAFFPLSFSFQTVLVWSAKSASLMWLEVMAKGSEISGFSPAKVITSSFRLMSRIAHHVLIVARAMQCFQMFVEKAATTLVTRMKPKPLTNLTDLPTKAATDLPNRLSHGCFLVSFCMRKAIPLVPNKSLTQSGSPSSSDVSNFEKLVVI